MSIFKVKKELVIEAANNALARIDAIQKASFEKEVKRHMKQGCVLRFLGVKPLSQKDAEACVIKASSTTDAWRLSGWRTRGQAKDLLAACAVTESGLVELDTDDAVFVRKWVSS